MKTKLNFAFGICLMIILASCGGSKEKTLDKDEMIAKNLQLKYNAVGDWDTISSYTSHFQNVFISQKKLMLFKGRIYDIVKVDSNYIVKVEDDQEDAVAKFLAVITFSSKQFNSAFTPEKSANGLFVIKVSKVTTLNSSIYTDEGGDNDDNTYLSNGFDHVVTIFTGIAIDNKFIQDQRDLQSRLKLW